MCDNVIEETIIVLRNKNPETPKIRTFGVFRFLKT